MNATEKTRLRALVNCESALRGAGIIYQSGMQQDVVQRPAADKGGEGLYLIVCRLAAGTSAGASSPTTSGLRALGISPAAVVPLGRTQDGYALYSARGGAVGRSAAENAALVGQIAPMTSTFLTLQEAIQTESRRFQSLSNASKARHDTRQNAIRNMR